MDDNKPKKGGKQPKRHAPKDKQSAKARRKKIIKAILENRSATQAGIDSGLSPKTAAAQVSAILKEPEVKSKLAEAFEAQGLDDKFLSEQLRELIMGTKVIQAVIINPDGGEDMSKEFTEVPDYVAKGKGLELAYKLKGDLNAKLQVDVKPSVKIVLRKFCTPENPEGEEV